MRTELIILRVPHIRKEAIRKVGKNRSIKMENRSPPEKKAKRIDDKLNIRLKIRVVLKTVCFDIAYLTVRAYRPFLTAAERASPQSYPGLFHQ